MGRGGHYIRVVGENGELGGRRWVSNKEFDRLKKARENQSDLMSQRRFNGKNNKTVTINLSQRNELVRSEYEKSQVRNVANANAFQASDWVSGKVRLKADEFMAIRNADVRRYYYDSVKTESKFGDDNTKQFWREYLEYLNRNF